MKKYFTVLLLAGMLAACKKSSSDTNIPPVNDSVKQTVKVIDSTALQLVSTETQLANGIYVYKSNGPVPAFKVNDVLVGQTGEGYIRVIKSMQAQSNGINFETTQASLEDIFNNQNIELDLDASDMEEVGGDRIAASNGKLFNLKPITLYKEGINEISLKNMTLELDPSFHMEMSYDHATLSHFEMSQQGHLNMKGHAELALNSGINGLQLVGQTYKLATFRKFIRVKVRQMPLTFVVKTDILFKYDVKLNASIQQSILIDFNQQQSLSLSYQNGEWQDTFNHSGNTSISVPSYAATASLGLNASLTAETHILLFSVVGPVITPAVNLSVTGSLATSSHDWDLLAQLWPSVGLSAEMTIFSKTLKAPTKTFKWDGFSFLMPDSMQIVSGNSQQGPAGQALPQLLTVQILDNLKHPVPFVSVYFKVTQGDGTLSYPNGSTTDAQGQVSASWMLGNTPGGQQVEARAVKANQTLFKGGPLLFTSTATTLENCAHLSPIPISGTPPAGYWYNALTGGTLLYYGAVYSPPASICPYAGYETNLLYYVAEGTDPNVTRTPVTMRVRCVCQN